MCTSAVSREKEKILEKGISSLLVITNERNKTHQQGENTKYSSEYFSGRDVH